uniref:C2H2-type domain-containing protein n=1 Tax=Glossina brevipalpis TaxID=37001 RepID=A0A1A9WNG6_9MUSC
MGTLRSRSYSTRKRRVTKQSTKVRNQSENVVVANQVNVKTTIITPISDRISPPSSLPQSLKRPLVCSNCGRKYQTLSTLRRHLRSECNQPKKFVCCICQRGFHHNFKLSDHYRRIHGIKNNSKLRYDNL